MGQVIGEVVGQVVDYDSYRKIIELWSDDEETNFAIQIVSDYGLRATTDPKARYTKVVDSSPYFEQLDYDWNFTLKTWINNRVYFSKINPMTFDTFSFDHQPTKT